MFILVAASPPARIGDGDMVIGMLLSVFMVLTGVFRVPKLFLLRPVDLSKQAPGVLPASEVEASFSSSPPPTAVPSIFSGVVDDAFFVFFVFFFDDFSGTLAGFLESTSALMDSKFATIFSTVS
jgi:hypothetical protein